MDGVKQAMLCDGKTVYACIDLPMTSDDFKHPVADLAFAAEPVSEREAERMRELERLFAKDPTIPFATIRRLFDAGEAFSKRMSWLEGFDPEA